MTAPDIERTKARITALQAQMKKQNIDGLFLIICMPYEGEQVKGETMLPTENHVAYLTGFGGSAGMMVVTQDKAAMFVDGRYTLAAAQVTAGTGAEAYHYADYPWTEWLKDTHKGGKFFAADYSYFSDGWVERTSQKLALLGLTLSPTHDNPVDSVWTDKPAPALKPAEIYPENLAGESGAAKRQRVAAQVMAEGASAALVTDPTSVAWLLNIRGSDLAIPGSSHIMVVLSSLLLNADGTSVWFVEPDRVNDDVRAHIGDGVKVASPSALLKELAGLSGKVVLTDKDTCSAYLTGILRDAGVVFRPNLCCVSKAKAVKNATELDGFRAAHRRDGAAFAKFLRWYDAKVASGTTNMMEADVTAAMTANRADANEFRCVSFESICAYGNSGAVIHYRSSPATDQPLVGDGLLLFDSGAQYVDGTTDITRVLPIGTPTKEMCDNYTRVLKGHIALATLKFPEGVNGTRIDAFSRQYLWQAGLDFDHGTGHGVGHYLSVHEGPQRLHPVPHLYPLVAGMVVSNEPGYYKKGDGKNVGYGIRIENLCAVIPAPEISRERPMLQFETLTLVPLDRRLIERGLLTVDEIGWVNDYHARIMREIGPMLDDTHRLYLQTICAPL